MGGLAMIGYLRIAGAVAAIALLVFLGWRVSLSFSQGEQLDQQQAHIASLEAAAARDQRIATELATFRGQQFDFAKAFRDAVASSPLTRKVPPHVDPKTGVVEPCVERNAPRYRSLFNSALDGPAANMP
jgi:hypothetical protein